MRELFFGAECGRRDAPASAPLDGVPTYLALGNGRRAERVDHMHMSRFRRLAPRPRIHIDECDERDACASSMGSAVPPCLCGARKRHGARGGARVTTSAKLVAATLCRSSASTAHAARSTARHEELLVRRCVTSTLCACAVGSPPAVGEGSDAPWWVLTELEDAE
jgi:hypothetical protein